MFRGVGFAERDGLIERLREWIARDKHRIEGEYTRSWNRSIGEKKRED